MPISGFEASRPTSVRPPEQLNLRAGEVVEVRSPPEILLTLDRDGALDALPFMPEMLDACGKRFRVYKRADKTCDTIQRNGNRRMRNTVHLAGLRCGGEAHGGCQAMCLLFWKESWLKRVASDQVKASEIKAVGQARRGDDPGHLALRVLSECGSIRNLERLASEPVAYRCQATELRRATEDLKPWDLSQYWRDWRSRNVRLLELGKAFAIWLYNTLQRKRRGAEYPFLEGKLSKTPVERLDLAPGELVEIKSKNEILATVDARLRNRGLSFDREMVKYCGRRYRVLRRVESIVDEKTGVIAKLPKDCIVLEGVVCKGDLHEFCPRSIYPYWREIWLKRVEPPLDRPLREGGTAAPSATPK